ncbi:MAG: hypothetical protein KGO53_01220 [Alphaproteobacteria bacterium]|nr:hypothetical protein [Alphaproteobacteria bacterium]
MKQFSPWWAFFGVLVAAGFCLFMFLSVDMVRIRNEHQSFKDALDTRYDIQTCIKTYRKDAIATADDIDLCARKSAEQALIDDFRIRQNIFFQHRVAEEVSLWLVVSITLGGVLLAALQLLLSFSLVRGRLGAGLPADGELSIEAGRISIRSAYVGAIILGISFAFFLAYMFYVFTLTGVSGERSQKPDTLVVTPLQVPALGKDLGSKGGLGPPSTPDPAGKSQ